jgi:Ser/Thr protein kinase RdoA (MazF antagonist)
MEPHRVIAIGRTAEVYAWNDRQVLKLFRPEWPDEAVEREASIARAVWEAGLPAPSVGNLLEVEGRRGLILERIDGPSLGTRTGARPWTVLRAARALADLHAQIHDKRVPALPSQRESLRSQIDAAPELPGRTREAVLDVLARRPHGEQLCHGDFHPENVLVTNGGMTVIDWFCASQGNPAADVARSSLLLTAAAPLSSPIPTWLLEGGRRLFHRAYLKRYLDLRPTDLDELRLWQPVIAAARLAECIPEEKDRLVKLICRALAI